MWSKHVAQAKAGETDVRTILPKLHEELLEKGFIKEGGWDILLKDAEDEARGTE